MRISDWSSDVCSSDLARLRLVFVADHLDRTARDDVETLRPKRAAQPLNRAAIIGLCRLSEQREFHAFEILVEQPVEDNARRFGIFRRQAIFARHPLSIFAVEF